MAGLRQRLILEIPHLRRFARALTRDADDADDLVQTTLERALSRGHLLRKPASLRRWLFRILYNAYLNARARRDNAEIAVDFAEHDHLAPAVEPPHDARLEVAATLTALARLPAEQRAAITLTAVEGLTYEEAAQVVDTPVGTLMSRIYRGRQSLRRSIDPDSPAEAGRPTLRTVQGGADAK